MHYEHFWFQKRPFKYLIVEKIVFIFPKFFLYFMILSSSTISAAHLALHFEK